jgi:YegS/Rv2252/BmrU family lipid kinase
LAFVAIRGNATTGNAGPQVTDITTVDPMEASERIALIVNPEAGGGRARDLLPDAERALRNHGLACRTVLTEGLEHGIANAREAVAAGEVPVVMSGDGLIGQIGGALAGTGATMGIVPAGRGNDLARVLEVPTEVEGAAAVIAAGVSREIDVGELGGRRFLGIASCGFDSDANRIANEARIVRGNLVYLYAALRALAAWKPARFELGLDGERVTTRGYSVGVCNSKAYGGGMYAAPDAELDDGLFDVVWMEDVSKSRFLFKVLPRVFKGTHVELPEVRIQRASTVEVSADRPFTVYADGDPLADLPTTVTLLPRALRVLAPAA